MFGWLKKKFNSFVPSDINKGMLTSNFCSAKLGSEITVPSNVICYVSYLDKIYLELKEGTYVLNEATLPTLYKKQLGKRDKIKSLKIDFFFINLNTFNISLVYVDKIPVNNTLTKLTATVNFACCVENATLFRDVVLSHFASVYAYQTERLVMDFSEQFLRNFFLHKKLNSYNLDSETNNNLSVNFSKYLAKMGLKLQNFSLNFQPFVTKQPNKNTPQQEMQRSFFNDPITPTNFNFNNPVEKSPKHEDSITQQNKTEEKVDSTSNQINKCPRCGCKFIQGSVYCQRCGYKYN